MPHQTPVMTPLLAHLIGDFVLQTDHMAERKTEANAPAAAHAVSYALPFFALTRRWQPLVVIAGTHFLIDRYRLARHITWARNQAAPKAWRPGHTSTGSGPDKPVWAATGVLILVDNTMHGVINRWALHRWSSPSRRLRLPCQ